MTQGIRIATQGNNAITGEAKDMAVDSQYSMLKGSLSGSGVVSVPQNGTETTVTIAHGLGHIPMVQAFWNDRDGDIFASGDFYQMPLNLFTSSEYLFYAYANSTNVILSFTINDFGGGGANVDIRYAYYIFVDLGIL